MLALVRAEAAQRGVPSSVLTFEPHPRDYFAAVTGNQHLAPARIGSLRDKLIDLAACGVDQAVVMPFNAALADQLPETFIDTVLNKGSRQGMCLSAMTSGSEPGVPGTTPCWMPQASAWGSTWRA